jgi:uncharacterized protein YjbI with pentapeptide repeats
MNIEEIVEKINNGTLKYRLVTDNDETAKGKVDLRNRTFTNKTRDFNDDRLIITNCSLDGADLANSIFEEVYIIDVSAENTSFSNCKFDACQINSLFCVNSNFFNVSLKKTHVISSTFSSTDMNHSNYIESSFTLCEINNSDMKSNVFNNFEISQLNINNCDMSSSRFINNELSECVFIDCNTKNIMFERTYIYRCVIHTQLDDGKHYAFENAEFIEVELKHSDFSDLFLKNITMIRVTAIRVDFADSVFSDFYISDSEFNQCIFLGSIFREKRAEQIGNNTVINPNNNPEYRITNVLFEGNLQKEDVFIEEAKVEVNYEEYPDVVQLSPLVIEPSFVINDGNVPPYTYGEIVELLTPNIKHVKLTISEMEKYRWYGISKLGNTTLEEWNTIIEQNNPLDKLPNIGHVFKCISVPEQKEEEAIVYIANPPCMDVHELSRQLDLQKIFDAFKVIGGNGREDYNIMKVSVMFAKLLYKLLSIHNKDEPDGSWTDAFKDIEKRIIMINHASFHEEEGIMYHPFFQASPHKLYDIIAFIEKLPLQIQVAWAQNYINEFITGYDQTLEDFDPNKRHNVMGFIASCINGNLEKILFSIRTAIVQFYKNEIPGEETNEEKRQTLIYSFTEGTLFQEYYGSLEGADEGASVEGYKVFIETNPESKLSDEQKRIFLSMFDDATILDKLNIMIGQVAGKRRNRIKKTKKKTIRKVKKTSRKVKKTIRKARKTIRKARKTSRKTKKQKI